MDALARMVAICGTLLLAAAAAMAQAAPAPAAAVAAREADSGAKPEAAGRAAAAVGPVYVRPFKPMQVTAARLRQVHTPVYFRSPLAEPSPSDRSVDACLPLAVGAAFADWTLLTVRVLGFPVEMAVCPPWKTRPLAR